MAAGLPVRGWAVRFDSFEHDQREFSILTGYGENHRIPSVMKEHFGFDQITLRSGRFTTPRRQTTLDISGGKPVWGMDNLALSAVVGRRRYFRVRKDSAFSFSYGMGGMYIQDNVQGQATKLNFTEQIGLAYQRSTGVNSALTVEYRFFHVSNAGIKTPNVGINASVFSVGYTWFK